MRVLLPWATAALACCCGCNEILGVDEWQGPAPPAPEQGDGDGADAGPGAAAAQAMPGPGRGFEVVAPWASWDGREPPDLERIASTFRVLVVDADPDGDLTDGAIEELRAGGHNRVISVLGAGACEAKRSYFADAPEGFVSCQSSGALTSPYSADRPDDRWASLASVEYRELLVGHVAMRLAERGIDGFLLDDMEVVEHGAGAAHGPCDEACAQGGLELVWELRQRFPQHAIVMRGATGAAVRGASSHGAPFAALLDGVTRRGVYAEGSGPAARAELVAWKDVLPSDVNGRPPWIATEDRLPACDAAGKKKAEAIFEQAELDGLTAYVAAGADDAPCFWSDL